MTQDQLNALSAEVTAITNQYSSGLITVIEFLNAMARLRMAIGDDVVLDGLVDLSTGLAYPTTEELAGIDAQHPPLPTLPKFVEDYSTTNPGLHMFYVKQGVTHLLAIDKCLDRLGRFSNCNLSGVILAITAQRRQLVTTNAAYCEADDIIESVLHPKRHLKKELEVIEAQ